MQYKRWRVVASKCVVNAAGAGAVFFLSACGGPASDTQTDTATNTPPSQPAVTETPPDSGLTLPAVWSTSALDGPIQDVALSTGKQPLLAVAFEGRGFQLFNLEGERLGAPIGFGITDLAQGRYADLDGAGVTLFPGINREGTLNAYLFGNNLQAPVEIPLPIDTGDGAIGLCAGPLPASNSFPADTETATDADTGIDDDADAAPASSSGGVMRLGYWTEGEDTTLAWGTLGVVDGNFTWRAGTPLTVPSPLGGCRIPANAQEPQTVSGQPIAVADLERPEGRYPITLTADGQLLAARPGEGPEAVTLREGLSVRVPLPPVAMDAQGAPLDGGYPFGVVVIAGMTAPDVHQAVFVDTTPLVAPAGGATPPGLATGSE